MITYESKKHPGIFVTSDGVVDPKFKTTLIQFADGKTQVLSVSTIKRWWTEVKDVETPAVQEEPIPAVEPIPADPLENKPTKITKEPKQNNCPDDFLNLLKYVSGQNNGTVKTWESKPRMLAILYKDGRAAMELYKGNKTFKVRIRPNLVDDTDNYETHSHSTFGVTLDLPYDKQGYKTLEKYIKKSIAYKPVRKQKNTKKEEN